MIENKVKLVVWDLDDTFWRGTLTEGGIEAVPANSEIVRQLSSRGIVNSICSKNDPEQVKQKLMELDIWDHFVFPAISFSPKGKAVADMIEGAALRAENVLFIDDNPSNLEEVKFFNPGIMVAHPADILDELLDHPHCAGKPDPELTRLKQYRFLQLKVEDRSSSALSNEEFLRTSNIRVTIDYEIEENFDRILELINRTNQLNYTKKRLNTPDELDNFKVLLNGSFSYHAGCVRASDSYGDYGLIGFFLLRRKPRSKKLLHFVFSCRTMNMGIEQYVHELLGKPDVDIVQPVSYGLASHATIDWINAPEQAAGPSAPATNRKLVLLGACDLFQLASYCSSERLEFVNDVKDGERVIYTDPCFVLNDRAVLQNCDALRSFPCWTYDDAVRLDNGLASAELTLLSLFPGMQGSYFRTQDGAEVRLTRRLRNLLKSKGPEWFTDNFEEIPLTPSDRLSRILQTFDAIAAKSPASCRHFVLGCHTQRESAEGRKRSSKLRYNEVCRAHCEQHPDRFQYVDLDTVVPKDQLVGQTHFTRLGYFAIARHILSSASKERPVKNPHWNDRIEVSAA
jgi:FkbH-like protein